MTKRNIWAALITICCGVGSLAAPTFTAEEARAILDPWTGAWAGQFKVYAQDGRLLTTLDVKQHYRWDGDIQRAEFHETDQDGHVITAEAKNYRDEQGRLVCEVVKSTGEASKHFGNFVDGYLFWYGNPPGRIETFRERVAVDEEGQRTYEITGFGVYGQGDKATQFFFSGSYREVAVPQD